VHAENGYRRSANQTHREGELPAQAAELLRAAEHLLVEQGFQALSLDNVAREAGQYKASVRYYFGSKAGLVAALVDNMTPGSILEETVHSAREVPPGEERVRRQLGAWRVLSEDADEMRAFFEVLPHILRDEVLRAKVAELYRQYRQTDVELFELPESVSDREAKALATIVSAVVDGVGAHALLDPDDVDMEATFDVLIDMVDLYLGKLRAQVAGQD
jgi:TetR/AcrR family transcriptional repressor of bet genes